MGSIEIIKKRAKNKGACDKIDKVNTIASLIRYAFTPQFLEFCEANSFPSIEDLDALSKEYPLLTNRRVYINAGINNLASKDGRVVSKNPHHVIAAGQTEVIMNCTYPDTTYYLILFHGAKARVTASDYAVVKVVEVGEGCELEFINQDETAILI